MQTLAESGPHLLTPEGEGVDLGVITVITVCLGLLHNNYHSKPSS